MTGDADFAEIMRTRLRADLRTAMKRRNAVEISTLRCLIAAVDNAGSVAEPTGMNISRDWSKGSPHVVTGSGFGPTEAARRVLSAADVGALLQREWRVREAAANTLQKHGRGGERERAEMTIISRYLGGWNHHG